jgi:predicted amidohydrolase YtcJ
VEHAQVVNVTDFARFKTLNVAASMQLVHCISDMSFSEERVGPVRIRGAYAWETFINESVPLFFGSDFPVELVNPFFGIAAAVTRQNAGGFPAAGWYPEQRVSLEQALFGFTQGAAWGAFQEKVVGSIDTGKYADFIVLPNGWFDNVTTDPRLLWTTKVTRHGLVERVSTRILSWVKQHDRKEVDWHEDRGVNDIWMGVGVDPWRNVKFKDWTFSATES